MRRRLAPAVLAAALAATGCSALKAQLPDPPAAVAGTRSGGTIRVAITRPAAVDPGFAYEPASRLIVSTMCDTLVNIDPETGDLTPGIAEKWVVGEDGDGSDIIVKLRKGLTFSDGTKVDAAAVKESLSRLARRDYASPLGGLMGDVSGWPSVAGVNDKGKLRKDLFGVRITDPYGLQFQLVEKDPEFIRTLAHPATAPLSRTALKREGFEHQPVCSGPYRLAGPWTATDSRIVLERNDDYEPSAVNLTDGGTGYADRVEFTVVKDAKAALAAYQADQVDITRVPAALRTEAQRLGPDFVEGDEDFVQYVGVGITPDAAWNEPAVRVALSQALDRQAIVDTVYQGGRKPATGFVPAAMGERFEPDICPEQVPVRGDVEAAKASLAAAHVDTLRGVKLPLVYTRSNANEALARAVADQWRQKLGLDVTLKPVDEKVFLRTMSGGSGAAEGFVEGWSAFRFSVGDYLGALATTSGVGHGNLSRFSDPAFDRFYVRKVSGVHSPSSIDDDQDERRIAYHRGERRVCELMPVIPVAFGRTHYLVRTTRLAPSHDGYLDVRGLPRLREIFVRV